MNMGGQAAAGAAAKPQQAKKQKKPYQQQQQKPIVTQPIGNQQPSVNPYVTDFTFRTVPCKHGRHCPHGLDCKYKHNESEISEFRLKKQLASPSF
jgi:hypothetical protein